MKGGGVSGKREWAAGGGFIHFIRTQAVVLCIQ